MKNELKDWLVRTRTGEILGPFSQRELMEELKKRTFTPEDEIAQSQGWWISAQTLTNRDSDEFTHTHTRNQTVTRSVHTNHTQSTATSSLAEDSITPTPRADQQLTDSHYQIPQAPKNYAEANPHYRPQTAPPPGKEQWDAYH